MAEDYEPLVRVELLVSARGHVAHRHGDCALDAGCNEFGGLADIDEAGFLFAEKGRRVGRGNLEIKHEPSVPGKAARVRAGIVSR